jgi:hypothetical protein
VKSSPPDRPRRQPAGPINRDHVRRVRAAALLTDEPQASREVTFGSPDSESSNARGL